MTKNIRIKFIAMLLGHSSAKKKQEKLLLKYLADTESTVFGKDHHFYNIRTPEEYKNKFPPKNYEDLLPYIRRIIAGESNILFKGKPSYMAITSGTTALAKYIPLKKAGIKKYSFASFITVINVFLESGKLPFGCSVFIGAPSVFEQKNHILHGRISGILNAHISPLFRRFIFPTKETVSISDYEERIQKTIKESYSKHILSVSGMPSWLYSFFQQLNHHTNQKVIDTWPKLKFLYVGGTSIKNYREIMMEMIGKEIDVVHSYIATEGFLGIGTDLNKEQYLLNLKNGIYYEFVIKETSIGQPHIKLGIEQLEVNIDYSMLLTDGVGKWSYILGDIIRFASLAPYIFTLKGRVGKEISIAGEHVLEEHIQNALFKTISATKINGNDIVAFSVHGTVNEKGTIHLWAIEFGKILSENEIKTIAKKLEEKMKAENHFYLLMRESAVIQHLAIIQINHKGFSNIMKSIGKLGDQYKIPIIIDDKSMWEKIIHFRIS